MEILTSDQVLEIEAKKQNEEVIIAMENQITLLLEDMGISVGNQEGREDMMMTLLSCGELYLEEEFEEV